MLQVEMKLIGIELEVPPNLNQQPLSHNQAIAKNWAVAAALRKAVVATRILVVIVKVFEPQLRFYARECSSSLKWYDTDAGLLRVWWNQNSGCGGAGAAATDSDSGITSLGDR